MRFSYSLILPYFIQVYLISPKFIMVSYERFTDFPSKYRYGQFVPRFFDSCPVWFSYRWNPIRLAMLATFPMRGRLFDFSPSRHPERSITVYVK